MPRVPLIEADGIPPGMPVPASLANAPDLMAAAMPFIVRAFAATPTLSTRQKEIVILRVSAQARCRYCTQTHTVVALGAGLSLKEVGVLRGDPLEDAFPDSRDRALIGYADAFAASPQGVSDDAFNALSAAFAAPDVVELTVVAGVTLMLNRYATALDLPVDPNHVAQLAQYGW